MIQLENVRKSYRTRDEPKVVLEDLTLTLPHANVGICGRNGSGKSILLRLIAGAETVDPESAEKAYVSALSSLERARVEADRQQRYVAAFVRPTLPEEAPYPRRIVPSITVFAIALVLWALGVLIVYANRDHAL
jgi:capsular polysaccharide transport system permease protein